MPIRSFVSSLATHVRVLKSLARMAMPERGLPRQQPS